MVAVGEDCLQIHISHTELVSAMCHFGDQMPCMFLQTTDSCADRLRDALAMNEPGALSFYDPSSDEDVHKFITVIFESLGDSDQGIECYFWNIFGAMQETNAMFKNGGQLLQVRWKLLALRYMYRD